MTKLRAMTNLEWYNKYDKHTKNAYVGYTDNGDYGFIIDSGRLKAINPAFLADQPYKTEDGKYVMVRCDK